MRRIGWVFNLILLAALPASVHAQYSLTILHNNDGESSVIDAGDGLEDYGGVARFATLVNNTRSFYEGFR